MVRWSLPAKEERNATNEQIEEGSTVIGRGTAKTAAPFGEFGYVGEANYKHCHV